MINAGKAYYFEVIQTYSRLPSAKKLKFMCFRSLPIWKLALALIIDESNNVEKRKHWKRQLWKKKLLTNCSFVFVCNSLRFIIFKIISNWSSTDSDLNFNFISINFVLDQNNEWELTYFEVFWPDQHCQIKQNLKKQPTQRK